MKPLLNLIGFGLTVTGALLAWHFSRGISVPVDKTELQKGHMRAVLSDEDGERLKRNDRRSKLCIILTILGGAIQVTGNFL